MKSTREILRQPLRLAVISAIGLIAALVSDGIGDVIGWVCLAYVIGVAGWHSLRGLRQR